MVAVTGAATYTATFSHVTNVYDIVFLDHRMPEMDGRVLLQELRADPRFQSLNVIAITADVDAKDECMKLGFSDVIFKPVTIAKIVECLPPPSGERRAD